MKIILYILGLLSHCMIVFRQLTACMIELASDEVIVCISNSHFEDEDWVNRTGGHQSDLKLFSYIGISHIYAIFPPRKSQL